jgi:hypothetical protein
VLSLSLSILVCSLSLSYPRVLSLSLAHGPFSLSRLVLLCSLALSARFLVLACSLSLSHILLILACSLGSQFALSLITLQFHFYILNMTWDTFIMLKDSLGFHLFIFLICPFLLNYVLMSLLIFFAQSYFSAWMSS